MFDLYLKHGRKAVDEAMDDWGEDGPTLSGVVGIHQTYDNNICVIFANEAAFVTAYRATGWEKWDNCTLEMGRKDDLVAIAGGPEDVRFFGDWGLVLSRAPAS